MNILKVSELNEQIKALLEPHFVQVAVQGEVSRPTYHSSGHLYFTLKDEGSALRCVMFRKELQSVPFKVEEGAELIVLGRIGVYSVRGEYQLYAKELHPAGVGSLQLAFDQLKKRLEAKGYFNKCRPLPQYISSLAIVTSKTGAALQDMLRIIQKRWGLIKVYVVDSLVQGKEAAPSLVQAIQKADSLGVDVIVVGRGGGSLEDLWAFNEEMVAEAIYRAQTPIVSAVGHEIDYVISDFVADHRAPTPSAAMEMILPDKDEILLALDGMMERLNEKIESILRHKGELLQHLISLLGQQSPQRRVEFLAKEIESLAINLTQAMRMNLAHKEHQIVPLRRELQKAMEYCLQSALSEVMQLQSRLQTIYASKKVPPKSAQILKHGKAVSLAEVDIGDRIELCDMEYRVEVKVDAKTKI